VDAALAELAAFAPPAPFNGALHFQQAVTVSKLFAPQRGQVNRPEVCVIFFSFIHEMTRRDTKKSNPVNP